MARLKIHQRKDDSYGLYKGKKTCLFYGDYDTIVPLGRAHKAARKARKASSNA